MSITFWTFITLHSSTAYQINLQQKIDQMPISFSDLDRRVTYQYPISLSADPIYMIVVPASQDYQAKIFATAAYKKVQKGSIDRIILIGQSDNYIFHGVALPWNNDQLLLNMKGTLNNVHIEQLSYHDQFHYCNPAFHLQSALQKQMILLEHHLGSCLITPLLIGKITGDDADKIAQQISRLHDDRTLIVFVVDIHSHADVVDVCAYCRSQLCYLYDTDANIVQAVQGSLVNSSSTNEGCLYNHQAYMTMVQLFKQSTFQYSQSYLVGYNAVVDLLNKDRFDSYASFIFQRNEQGNKNHIGLFEQSQLMLLAKKSLHGIFEPEIIKMPCMISYEMMQSHGAFVAISTMTDHGTLLKGCMGEITSSIPLYKLVENMTIQSACHDYRFYPLMHQEVTTVLLSISIISDFQQLFNYQDIQETDGILFEYDHSYAISLPNLQPVHGWNYISTLLDLCAQAEVSFSACYEPQARIFRFSSKTFQEE